MKSAHWDLSLSFPCGRWWLFVQAGKIRGQLQAEEMEVRAVVAATVVVVVVAGVLVTVVAIAAAAVVMAVVLVTVVAVVEE